jgi:SNF2 family DNA or RNA helicase
MSIERRVTLEIVEDSVVVTGPEILHDRTARLFFTSIIGANEHKLAWRCPRRNLPLPILVVRINTFLESKGYIVNRVGIADDEVRKELEKKLSFQRAREAALALRGGHAQVSASSVSNLIGNLGWDESKRVLYPHQEAGLIHALTAVNAANFSVPGSGKTITALATAATHIANAAVDVVIVVGPLSCFAPWEKEVLIALPNTLQLHRVRGTASERHAAYRNVKPRQMLLISYATAAADKFELIELCRTLKVMLIVDESHRVKRFRGGLWAPALMELSKHARVRMILSGTPMPQSGRDLYSQMRILWPSGELTGPADDFANRVDKDFEAVLTDVKPFVSRTPKDELGLQPYTVIKHTVEQAPIQAEIYQLIESQFRRYLEDAVTWKDKLEALKRGRPIRMLQAAANPDLLNKIDGFYSLPRFAIPNPTLLQRLADYRHLEVAAKSLKGLEIINDIIKRSETTGGKVVCWSNFIHNLDQFSEHVRSKLQIPVFQIDGRVPVGDQPLEESTGTNYFDVDTREGILNSFLHTVGPAVLVANPASTSESISLHESCHNALYLDRTYDSALFLQSIDRIHRLGLPPNQSVEVHIILSSRAGRRTIDHLVDESLNRKEQVMRQLLEGVELAPLKSPEDPLESAEGNVEDLSKLLRYLLGEEIQYEGDI